MKIKFSGSLSDVFSVSEEVLESLREIGCVSDGKELSPKEMICLYGRVVKGWSYRALAKIPMMQGRMGVSAMCKRLAVKFPRYSDKLVYGLVRESDEQYRDRVERVKILIEQRAVDYINQVKSVGRLRKEGLSFHRIAVEMNLEDNTARNRYIDFKRMQIIGENELAEKVRKHPKLAGSRDGKLPENWRQRKKIWKNKDL